MPRFLSEELGLGDLIDNAGVFDSLIDLDSCYFINICRLKNTKVPEFLNSYNKINEYFRIIGKLLKASIGTESRAYRAAYDKFDFPEVNEINLGVSKGKSGRGFGPKLRARIIKDAKEIIDLGSNDPEIFHLIGLFEDLVGPDRLSDMVARILYDDIYAYTIRVNKELGITPNNYEDKLFNKDGVMYNPYKEYLLFLLPKDILHEIPMAKDWEDIDRVCQENALIKREFNEFIGEEWRKLSSHSRKEFVRNHIFKYPEKLNKLLDSYRNTSIEPYDFENDEVGDYLVAKLAKELPIKYPIQMNSKPNTSMEIAKVVCDKFKDLVENNKASELLYSSNGKTRGEKIVQRAFLCVAISYCEANNLDISPESDAGRGPVDFKMSSGLDKTIVEIKLTTNPNIVHGFKIQIEEYAKAEKTDNKILLVVDNGGPKTRIEAVTDLYNERLKTQNKVPLLIVVDANVKDSASTYLRKTTTNNK